MIGWVFILKFNFLVKSILFCPINEQIIQDMKCNNKIFELVVLYNFKILSLLNQQVENQKYFYSLKYFIKSPNEMEILITGIISWKIPD